MAGDAKNGAISIWKEADAVCFDVDSTVSPHEGIDVLAEFCGVGKQVAEYTKKAMEGIPSFFLDDFVIQKCVRC